MKVLVMGGTRFIGRHVVQQLLHEKHQVTVFTRGQNNRVLSSDVQKFTGNRKDKTDLAVLFKNHSFDAIIDLSAYLLDDVKPLLFFAKEKTKQYIFCSTAMVYNFNTPEQVYWGINYNKNDAYESYGYHKHQCELFLSRYLGRWFTVLRPTYVYGPFDYSNRLTQVFSWASTQNKIYIPGSSLKRRTQMVFAPDLAKAFTCALNNPNALGQTFNIAYKEVIDFYSLVELALKSTGESINLSTKRLSENSFPFSLKYNTVIDTGFTSKQLEFVAKTDYSKGFKQTFDWWKENRSF